MFKVLRRHPFAVDAFFRWSLVVTYAFPPEILRPMIPQGLTLDTHGEGAGVRAFLAIALVQTENLRPKGVPAALGRDFFLSGYRIFTRFSRDGRPSLRGLRILRSDTDRRLMVHLGNLFTHYAYRYARVRVQRTDDRLTIDLVSQNHEADLHVDASLKAATMPPLGSPFRSLADARRFAGPLPHTFDVDVDPSKMLIVQGVRESWDPRPVTILAHRSSFVAGPQFRGVAPQLANAFFVENVKYGWRPGRLEAIA